MIAGEIPREEGLLAEGKWRGSMRESSAIDLRQEPGSRWSEEGRQRTGARAAGTDGGSRARAREGERGVC